MTAPKIILNDSPDAAQLKTVELWVAFDGRMFNDEHTARYAGCTHVRCECGNITEKLYVRCQTCRDKKAIEKYNAMPFKEWDGTTPLVIYGSDQYFYDEGDLADYCADYDIDPKELKLCLCDPHHLREFDGSWFEDDLPEDGELPDEIIKALDEFNAKIKAYNKTMYWVQGSFRTTYVPAE